MPGVRHAALLAGLLFISCSGPSLPGQTASRPPATARPEVSVSATTSPSPAACVPNDQDSYIYNPDRLLVKAACIRVTGTVDGIEVEPDGDRHIRLHLDPGQEDLLTLDNALLGGDLLLEAICLNVGSQRSSVASCSRDHDPLTNLPAVGAHITAEGRHVIDQHHGWAELHPLYRWTAD